MKVIYKKRFLMAFRKLPARKQQAMKGALNLFRESPFDPRLDNHPLKWKLKGKRAISASFDLRVVFEEHENYEIVLLLKVGSHEEMY